MCVYLYLVPVSWFGPLFPLNILQLAALEEREVIKLFSYSSQLSTNFILLINVKMPTIVGILTFISMINTKFITIISMIKTTSEGLKAADEDSLFVGISVFMSS